MTPDRLPTQDELRTRRPPVAPLVFRAPVLPPGVVLDDQCPVNSGACDQPCGGTCLRDACPDDPDGLHHSGCGCDDVDPLNP